MIHRIVSAYKTRRWFRWSVDVGVVLVLVIVVAVVHTVIGSSPVATYQRIQRAIEPVIMLR